MNTTITTTPNDPRVFHPKEEPHHPEGHSTSLGFWIYLMSDCLIFSILFATYAVLGHRYGGGPGPKELFDLGLIAVNTAMLLCSSITYGFAMLEMHENNQKGVMKWLGVTAFFGLCFLGIELYEFSHLILEGAGPWRSAFLSAFFTLVATHGLHVTFGLVWMATLVVQVRRHGLIPANRRRLECLSLFWHFLDVIWIGVFTFVYLMGMI
ncbi:cytochrome o ubiquinol oxidase subunit III [Paracoccus pacificus]|uniref:Cytochrome bo(3) ubiquinol oxidase subunit 3 n=1 Tax=Paracoccus pacificus TaxID=1463598 RepID=A0ABW4R5F4_9RHOB